MPAVFVLFAFAGATGAGDTQTITQDAFQRFGVEARVSF